MKDRNIKLVIAYDGTEYHGWQRQLAISNEQLEIKNKEETDSSTPHSSFLIPHYNRTVQGVIEEALEKMHGHPVPLTGAGRTDAGVHAAGQAANFYTGINSIPAEKFVPALNSLLPKDVRIIESQEVPENFHARFSASARTYRYHFICGKGLLPHENRYNLQLRRYPDIKTLNAYCHLLFGETDCRIFAGAGDAALTENKSTNRFIYNAYFYIEKDRLIFEIKANAFMRNMVRSIAGTFLFYEEKSTNPKELQEIIASGERNLAGPTLPPQGLFLWKVDY